MKRRHTLSIWWVCVLLGACGESFEPPDTSLLAPGVREAIATAQASFDEGMAAANDAAARARAWGQLGMVYHAHHLIAAAADCYVQAIRIDDRQLRWHYFLALARRDLGDLAQAQKSLERAVELEPGNRSAQYYLATTLLDLGESQRARDILQALQADRRDGAVLALAGRAALFESRYEEAASAFERALALQPGATRLHYPLAHTYRELGQPDRAASHLRLAGTADPVFDDPLTRELAALSRSVQYYLERGKAAVDAGNYDVAERDFRIAIEVDPFDASAHANLGILLRRTGRAAQALQSFAEAARLEPGNANFRYLSGELLERLGRGEEAVQLYRDTIERDPSHARAWVLSGNDAMRSGRFSEALQFYQGAAGLFPGDVNVLYHSGLAALAAGDCRAAIDWLDNAMSRQSSYAPVIIAVIRARSACPDFDGDATQTLDLARRLYEAVPDDDEVRATLAMALAADGKFAEAVQVQPAGDAFDANAARYRAGKRALQAWPPDAPVFRPAPLSLE